MMKRMSIGFVAAACIVTNVGAVDMIPIGAEKLSTYAGIKAQELSTWDEIKFHLNQIDCWSETGSMLLGAEGYKGGCDHSQYGRFRRLIDGAKRGDQESIKGLQEIVRVCHAEVCAWDRVAQICEFPGEIGTDRLYDAWRNAQLGFPPSTIPVEYFVQRGNDLTREEIAVEIRRAIESDYVLVYLIRLAQLGSRGPLAALEAIAKHRTRLMGCNLKFKHTSNWRVK